MNPETVKLIEKELKSCLDKQKNTFDLFLEAAQRIYQAPAHTLVELRARDSTKVRGDVFEHFCYLYLTRVSGWTVWFLADLPDELCEKLGLKRQDLGIDLIGSNAGKFIAIQCKYRNRLSQPTVVSWKQLSTFYALATRTGPYHQHLVMTTADYVRHVGRRSEKDRSICYRKFCGLNRDSWLKMIGNEAPKIPKPNFKIVPETFCGSGHGSGCGSGHGQTQEEFVRAQRLKFFGLSNCKTIP